MTLEPVISRRMHLAIDRIDEEMKDRGVVDVLKWWLFMATDIIGELSFGESFRILEAGEVGTPSPGRIVSGISELMESPSQKTQYSIDMEHVSSFQPMRTMFLLLAKLAEYLPLPLVKQTADWGKRLGFMQSN